MKIRSVRYVYNSEAAQAWFDLYIELLMKAMMEHAAHTLSQQDKGEGEEV